MEQYIKKSTLVAEIERRISLFKKEKKIEKWWSAEASQMNVISLGARITMLEEILSFLDTLEVKEADLEKEIDRIDDSVPGRREDIEYIARHFFELGLKAQKGE